MSIDTPRRYFDNAATSFPKPPGVVDAMCAYMAGVGASAGRGAYREAIDAGRMLGETRAAVRTLFGGSPNDHVVFTLNGSDALNIAIKSVVRDGDHVVTTRMEHNSVLRPLSALRLRMDLETTLVAVDPVTTRISVDAITAAIRPNTSLVVLNHASNVTGVLQPLDDVAALCRDRGVLLLVDVAQSAGHVPIDLSKTPVDLLASPGHKGMMGPTGTGVLVVRAGVEQRMRTVREGGTGSQSESPDHPESMPDKFEAGSHNAVGLAGLHASLAWLRERTIAALRAHEVALSARMIERLKACEGLRWFGPCEADARVGVFSVRIDDIEPAELSVMLEERFGVLTRSGLHCAPFAHETIGTAAEGGTTRLSFGAFLTDADVDAAAEGLAEICRLAGQMA